jgi:multidrug transporter EmrE-like cation transporter
LQGSKVLIINAAWDGLSALIESGTAMIVLGERFDDPLQYVGILFIIAGLFFLRLPVINESKFVFPKLFM